MAIDNTILREQSTDQNENEGRIKEFIKNETKKYFTKFWGKRVLVKPHLVKQTHGDGLQIAYLTPLATRPHYYVLRVDSAVDFGADDFDCDFMLEMVEEEYDCASHYEKDEKGRLYDIDENIKPFYLAFPMLDESCGVCYGTIKNFILSESANV